MVVHRKRPIPLWSSSPRERWIRFGSAAIFLTLISVFWVWTVGERIKQDFFKAAQKATDASVVMRKAGETVHVRETTDKTKRFINDRREFFKRTASARNVIVEMLKSSILSKSK